MQIIYQTIIIPFETLTVNWCKILDVMDHIIGCVTLLPAGRHVLIKLCIMLAKWSLYHPMSNERVRRLTDRNGYGRYSPLVTSSISLPWLMGKVDCFQIFSLTVPWLMGKVDCFQIFSLTVPWLMGKVDCFRIFSLTVQWLTQDEPHWYWSGIDN